MMIPTRGASTSISSNAASTSGIGSRVAVSVSVSVCGSRLRPGSAVSIPPRVLSVDLVRYALDRAPRDVLTHLHPVEADLARRLVGTAPRGLRIRAEPGDPEHPASGGHDPAVGIASGPRVGDLDA